MTEVKKAPLQREHVHKSGVELQAAYALEMDQKISHQNFHVSLPPAVMKALVTECRIAGVYRTAAVREAIVDWIAERIDKRALNANDTSTAP